ncbi:prepilin-type N-terminal cleavage/methylation domain-containing protein [uncultured Massilia sp.]|uniref:prepilin-type N-terminal cleavage/methylation domain-containing protein n=1 Tax=uncultured Massilia sp. TaxID=169973 RepID=UPI0025EFAED7|nr:prepilin-type N-terminal cleavage/methylation domain-containing protein [uncultured Massilia sp.]
MRRTRGFTLVELVIVIVLVGIVGAIVSMQLRPALASYLAVGRRANLADQADGALRRLVADARAAVPNSLRLLTDCNGVEMVPTSDGGRLRTLPDVDRSGSVPFDPAKPAVAFDVLSQLPATAPGDWIVMANQSAADVYGTANSAQIDTLAASPDPALGVSRMSLKSAMTLPGGYNGGRFVVVPNAQLGVSYVCANPGVANGSGTGVLLRVSGYPFRGRPAATCPDLTNAPVVASKVAACTFIYRENENATQQSGYVQLTVDLADGGERTTLTMGAHVENVP